MGALNSTVNLPANASTLPGPDPAQINGDHDLSSDDRAAYLNFHAARNTANARRSRQQSVQTRAAPLKIPSDSSLASPSRLLMDELVRGIASKNARYWGGRSIRVLDIGCGSGYACSLLQAAGLAGEYIGLDHAPHPAFDGIASASFARRRIITDILDLDPEQVGPVDLLISMTALEHFEDDAQALRIARRTLAPGAAEIHVVPAEDGLRLWKTHGWRQYSPACVRALCPGADIYRIGGAPSALLHHRAITIPNERHIDWRSRHPALYRTLRTIAIALDPLSLSRPASLYAAVKAPGASA